MRTIDDKLATAIHEVTTLLPRLTEPYASHFRVVLRELSEVKTELSEQEHSPEKEGK